MLKMIKYRNGLTVLVDKIKKTNKVSMSININTGAYNDPDDKLGLAHLAEHMMFTGTDTKSNEDIFKEYAKYDINFNGTTSYNVTSYYITAVKKYFHKGVDVMVDQFNNYKFTEENLKKEKSIVTDELEKGISTDRSKFVKHANNIFYKGTIRERDIIGTKKSIKSATLLDIENFIKENYVPNNIIMSFAGDITISEVKKIVKRFKLQKAESLPVIAYKEEKNKHTFVNKKIVYKKDVLQDYVDIYLPSLSMLDADEVAQTVFYNLFNDRLMYTLRQKHALVYGVKVSISNTAGYGSIKLSFSTNPKNLNKAINALNKLVKDIKKNGFTEKEIADFKLSEDIRVISLSDSPRTSSVYNAYYTMMLNKKVTYAELIKEYANIDNKMLIDFANKYLVLDNALLALMTKDTNKEVLDKIVF